MPQVQKKLGRLKPKYDRRTLQFNKYFSTLPYVPQTSHWLNAPPLGMLMNDTIGDCTIAGIGHNQRIWSKQNNIDYAMTDAQALAAYIAVTGLEGAAFNPATGENDNGCACLDVLKYAQNTGTGGQKIGPYVQVDVSNHSHVEHAQFWFGGLYIGINMPVSAQNQPVIWDVPKGGLTGPGTPGSWGGHCFTGDTKISLLDGREVSLFELTMMYADKEFWVYSCDERGNIVPGKAHHPRKTGKKQKIVAVTLDNGEVIKCTPDHRFLMRNGKYKEAKDLKAGESLMPLYRRDTEKDEMGMPAGYELYYNPMNKKWYLTHRLVANRTQGHYSGIVHHDDFNKKNNDPVNLKIMDWDEHTKLHTGMQKPDQLIAYSKSTEGKQKSREMMQALWADPVWRANRLKKNGENATKRLNESYAAGIPIGFLALPEKQRKAISAANGKANVGKMHTLEVVQKRVRTLKDRWANDPDFRERMEVISIDNLPNANNHKVMSVEEVGYEDVYDITVDKYHNFALSAGVFVHNCVAIAGHSPVGLDVITWGERITMTWAFWDSYVEECYAILSNDFVKNPVSAPNGLNMQALIADLALVTA
jgi:hypothetical protein